MAQKKEEKTSKDLRSILLVDRNHEQREAMAVILRKELGCVVLEAGTPAEALKIIDQGNICLLVTDLFLPDKDDGINLLKKTHKTNPEIITIAGIPSGDRKAINEVLKLGAFMYINSPYDFNEAVIVISRGMSYHDVLMHKRKRGPKFRKSEGYHGMIGKSACMLKLFDLIDKVAADYTSTVLIQGESGTGKELVAQVIHAESPRRGKSIVPVNCAAIPDELLESELFGYVKGAFTGANQSKMGRIQYAEGGTLFLDEIGDMKSSLQAKLLRVLQEKEFEPVGGLKPIPINIRIIAATHRNLEKMVEEGTFRTDLYYRLNVVPVTIPPLKERSDDIPILIDKFVLFFNRNKKTPLHGFEPEAIAALIDYPWPGNIRELENLVQHMAILHGGETISLADLPQKFRAHHKVSDIPAPAIDRELLRPGNAVDFNTLINDFENRLIIQALSITKGNKKEAAKLLNLKRTTLLEKIKKKNIQTSLPEKLMDGPSSDEFRF